MSTFIDKLIPEILIDKYLEKEFKELRKTFDRNWDEKRDGWRDESIEWLAKRIDAERAELERAIKEMREDAFLHSSVIYRTKRVRSEFLDVALVALMGADKARIEYEALEKRQKKGSKIEAPEPELEIVGTLDAEPELEIVAVEAEPEPLIVSEEIDAEVKEIIDLGSQYDKDLIDAAVKAEEARKTESEE